MKHFFYFYGKTKLLVFVKELVSVEDPDSVEDVPFARFACYGRKINILENCRLLALDV